MLAVMGLNHESAPEQIRERGAFIKRTALETLDKLLETPGIQEAVLLSTCNRSEIFVYTDDEEAALKVLEEIFTKKLNCETYGGKALEYLYFFAGEKALTHLFELACGLDSMVVGEDQILGQLKDALDLASSGGYSAKYMNQIFRDAITFAKRIKTEYKISEVPRSLSATAVKLIKKHYPENYDSLRILIIGSGKMGTLALKHLGAEGFKHVTMSNRTYHPGDEYREIFAPINILKYSERYEKLNDFDIVISATSSPHTIFKKELLPLIDHPLTFIDLALPVDIERSINEIENIKVIGIDDLKSYIDEKSDWQREKIEEIKKKIPPAVNKTTEWINHTGVDSLVSRLNESANKQARETIEILNSRYQFTGKDLKFLEKIVYSGFSNLIKPTLLKLKQIDSDSELKTVKEAANIIDKKKIIRKNGKSL